MGSGQFEFAVRRKEDWQMCRAVTFIGKSGREENMRWGGVIGAGVNRPKVR